MAQANARGDVSPAAGGLTDLGPDYASGCLVTQGGGSQVITLGTPTDINFTAETYDTDNYHDNVTNNTRITAPFEGWYRFDARCNLTASAVLHTKQLVILVNNIGVIGQTGWSAITGGGRRFVVWGRVYMEVGHYAELRVLSDVGATVTLAEFSAHFLKAI